MLSKAYLTSHSRMFGSRWVITPSRLSGSWRSFLYSSSVFLRPLLHICCFCYIHTISVLFWAHLCMKCSRGISHFLEEISSLSHFIVFLYFIALITEEGFLISPWYSLELCIQMGLSSHFSFAFCFYLWNKHLKLVLVRSGMTWSHVLLRWFGPLNGRVLELWRLQSGTLHVVTFIFASWTHCACSLHLETRETKMSKRWS